MSLGPPQVGDWREGADGAAVHGQDQIPDLLGPGGPQPGLCLLTAEVEEVGKHA